MPIPRNMPSLEQGLYDAIKKLKDIGIEESTIKYSKPKKISFFRRCADPNSKTHNIDHIDSVAIDKECLNIDGSHPMLSAHEALLKKHMDENISLKKKNISEVINQLAIIISEFQNTVYQAQSIDSPGGVAFTAEEKIRINDSINKVEVVLKDLRIQIGK